MAHCLIIPRKQLPSEEKLLDSITMCIVNRMLESYSDAIHTKRHRRHSKKFTMLCTKLTNPDPSSETGSEDLAIIGRRWSLTPSPILSDAMPVRSTITSSIKRQEIFIPHPLHGHSRCGEWMWLDPSVPQHPKDITSSGHKDYFSKWVEVVPLKEVKTLNVIKFIKHHMLFCFGVPRRVVHDNGPQFISQAF